jgi:hypothetical protein
MEYKYKAMDGQGKECKGTVAAKSENEACSLIKEMGQFPISITPVGAENGEKEHSKARKGFALIMDNLKEAVETWDGPNKDEPELSDLERETSNALKLSGFGKHIVDFVCKCVKDRKNPKEVLLHMYTAEQELPIQLLFAWIENPTDENVKKLGKRLNIDIDKTILNMEQENAKE